MVATRQRFRRHPNSGDTLPFESLESVLSTFQSPRRIWIIGGATIYKAALPLCNRIFLTNVTREENAKRIECDVAWDGVPEGFVKLSDEMMVGMVGDGIPLKGIEKGFSYEFCVYERR